MAELAYLKALCLCTVRPMKPGNINGRHTNGQAPSLIQPVLDLTDRDAWDDVEERSAN